MEGIRAKLVIEEPPQCDVAAVSRDCGPVASVSRSAVPDEDGRVHDEFTVREGDCPDTLGDATAIFQDDRRTIYRLARSRGQGCACECIEREGCTVRDVQVVDGTLFVTVLAADLDGIRAIVSTLRESRDGVQVGTLVRAPPESESGPLWVTDPGELTARQREVLETAYEMGYFEYPRNATAEAVATELDVATPTFTEHLAAAQHNLLEGFLDGSNNQSDTTIQSSHGQ
ncbi:Transcriptional regulator, contains HTH domain [Halorhabdus sp. SVX81]|uniref:helix-turn-helix domain-containing protein n=1 Tax=Halorhabdus sp. SVX81 TaxID=2978283 RepID=UPI0023DA2F5D|nr:helix-turn-helix domain-containing protein [Halorhabdus sp. SVX81]WEL17533.1 Transcriptional regulator, contains HTH domain [Halorhabdus sp. SVX81]